MQSTVQMLKQSQTSIGTACDHWQLSRAGHLVQMQELHVTIRNNHVQVVNLYCNVLLK